VLLKAERRVAEKNLEGTEGTSSDPLLFHVVRIVAASNILHLGIRAHPENVDLICNSVFSSNSSEVLLENLGHSTDLDQDSENEDCLEEIEKFAANELCGDLLEEAFNVDSYRLDSVKSSVRKENKSSAKSRKIKTCRVNLFPKSNMMSK
jgi:hypothetical protein